MTVIAMGNPFDGLTLIGPFDDPNEANDYADENLDGEEWHVVTVDPPAATDEQIDRSFDAYR